MTEATPVNRPRSRPDAEELTQMLLEKSTMDIAEECGVSRTTVCVWINDDLGPNRARELWLERRLKVRAERAATSRVRKITGTTTSARAATFSDKNITDALVKVAGGARSLTAIRYGQERTPDMPSAPAIMRRFGTWNAAVAAAGLDPILNRGRKAEPQLITGVATAVAYLSHCYKTDTRATAEGVKAFAISRGIPSTAVVRGRWSDLKAEALRRWDEFTDEPKFWEEAGVPVDLGTDRPAWSTADGLTVATPSDVDGSD